MKHRATVLLYTFQADKHRASINPADLALISCRTTDEEKWLIALVESKGADTKILISGEAKSVRDEAAEGFMTRVEGLLWKRVGKEHACIE